MFDGPILAVYPGTQQLIYMEPKDFDKDTGHFHNRFCWCVPKPIKYEMPNGEVIDEWAHKAIIYGYMEDQLNGQPEK